MLLNEKRKKVSPLSLTPLIDVVFLLLVFFMLASTFSSYSSLNIVGGTASSGQSDPSAIALMRIKEDGSLELNGNPIALDDLAAQLDAFALGGGKAAVLKLREGTKVQAVVTILEKAKKSKISRLAVVR